eukprot:CAMPEP_0117691628 /NCGR_PEP_ID=MMETSP0804-20121206/25832_1 /TAXON_ID=1074897 /ORGANISM="Tetraselmis astigmatica, Strain CCMP880" /LENGTH=531 /DNA_ID=CAMNT_0005504895 /DNA_START=302 /DNA_END=1898 /DNA_ORIENTATION=+
MLCTAVFATGVLVLLVSSCDASRPIVQPDGGLAVADHREGRKLFYNGAGADATSAVSGTARSLRATSTSSDMFKGDGRIMPLIGNGELVPEGRKQWMVSLRLRRNGSHFCGAALIHEKFVVTAAHCLDHGDPEPDVQLGRRQRRSEVQGPPGSQVQVFKTATSTKHPQWNGDVRNGFDIAVIELGSRASGYPILDLPDRVVDIDSWDGALEVIGWGETESGTLADDLMFAYVEVFDRSTCNMPSLYGPFIRDEMFCAGGKGREPCMADSGGPIVIPGSPDRLIGITSFGRFGLCGKQGAPAVYTLINPFIAWLREVTGLPSPSRVPSAQLPARNPPPTPPAPSSNGLHPSPAADKNLMLPGIVAKVIKVGLQAEGACLDGGVDWQPGSRASGCQHCNAYPDVATIAAALSAAVGRGRQASVGRTAGALVSWNWSRSLISLSAVGFLSRAAVEAGVRQTASGEGAATSMAAMASVDTIIGQAMARKKLLPQPPWRTSAAIHTSQPCSCSIGCSWDAKELFGRAVTPTRGTFL